MERRHHRTLGPHSPQNVSSARTPHEGVQPQRQPHSLATCTNRLSRSWNPWSGNGSKYWRFADLMSSFFIPTSTMRVILCLTPLFFSFWLFVINAYAFDAKPESSEIDNGIKCDRPAERLHLIDEPYQNYFYSDCNSASQVVVTSPLPSSDPELISPRLLVCILSKTPTKC